ncbi:MAG: hypothetical protein FWH21_00010 [Kiritimatiellaeota bacterium]|nr:hypothetical protein [Kiritimatiellota bacterium]
MKTRDWFLIGLGGSTLSVLILTGCGTTQSLIERRIQHEYVFFAELPEDTQARLRNGQLQVGDALSAAWIVYGDPTYIHERTTETSTNMVWSYSTMETQPIDQFNQVYYPTSGRRGITYMESDLLLQRSYLHSRNDYLRIELSEGKVIAIDRMKQE